MPAPTGAHVYKNAIVTIDTVEYANQVNKARLVPDQPVQTFRSLDPSGTSQDVDTAVWTFELGGLQINTAGGLAKALRDANGGELDIVLQPKAGTAQATATFTIVALMPEFGGEQGNWLTQDLSFPVIGQPAWGTSA